jgi:serine/threonine protein kinase
MIDNKGNVKLIDFDTARIYKHYQSQDTIFMGTIGYAPPEQYGLNQTDERTDIYSLGVLMNVMLTGELPEKRLYNGKLRKVIIKCTQSVPDNRYQTAEELKLNL